MQGGRVRGVSRFRTRPCFRPGRPPARRGANTCTSARVAADTGQARVAAAASQSQNLDPRRFVTIFDESAVRHSPGSTLSLPLLNAPPRVRLAVSAEPDLVVDLIVARSSSLRFSGARVPSWRPNARRRLAGRRQDDGDADSRSRAFQVRDAGGYWRVRNVSTRARGIPEVERRSVGSGTESLSADFVLIHDYEQERNGKVALTGHAVLRWNAAAERYVLLWFDSMGMPPNEFVRRPGRDVLTLVSQGSGRAGSGPCGILARRVATAT